VARLPVALPHMIGGKGFGNDVSPAQALDFNLSARRLPSKKTASFMVSFGIKLLRWILAQTREGRGFGMAELVQLRPLAPHMACSLSLLILSYMFEQEYR
jgi:hypothetical protein